MGSSLRRAAVLTTVCLLAWPPGAGACPLCQSETGDRVRAALFGRDFGLHSAVTVLPFAIFVGIVALLHFGVAGDDASGAGNRASGSAENGPARSRGEEARAHAPLRRRPLIAAGTSIGIGMGGFIDGILFHQILQLHNMLSAKYPKVGVAAATALVNMEINMFWDGLFHAFTWAMTALGGVLLWRAARMPDVPLSTGTLVGSMAAGWGLFNLVEGLLDHELLGIHHVVEAGNHLAWDLAFLGSGMFLLTVGYATVKAAGRVSVESPRP